MAIGDRIKRVRNFRGMTQKALGMAIGFDEKSADVRVAQYESNVRTPKKDLLEKIADVLDVNYFSLSDPTYYNPVELMQLLFDLDTESRRISIYEIEDKTSPYYPDPKMAISFDIAIMSDYLAEWKLRKNELQQEMISEEEYIEWKLNWPDTQDYCGKSIPKKEWRK